MPLKSDQSSAPSDRTAGGRRYLAQRPIGSVRRAAARRKPSVEVQATIAAHSMIERPRKPTQ
jgi:hypothetical protein